MLIKFVKKPVAGFIPQKIEQRCHAERNEVIQRQKTGSIDNHPHIRCSERQNLKNKVREPQGYVGKEHTQQKIDDIIDRRHSR